MCKEHLVQEAIPVFKELLVPRVHKVDRVQQDSEYRDLLAPKVLKVLLVLELKVLRVFKDPPALHLVYKDLLVPLAHKVFRVLKEQLVLVQQALRVYKAHRAQLVLELPESKVHKADRVLKEQLVLVQQGLKVFKELLVLRVYKVR